MLFKNSQATTTLYIFAKSTVKVHCCFSFTYMFEKKTVFNNTLMENCFLRTPLSYLYHNTVVS